jgi:3'-5' exoribonuclease-like protein
VTRYFYDLEFLQDGRTIDLISIGIAADDGREYYAVVEEAGDDEDDLYKRIVRERWLMENVISQLPLRADEKGKPRIVLPTNSYPQNPRFSLDLDHPAVLPRHVIAKQVKAFLCANPGDIELWAWYGAYDHVCLMQLWGSMIDRPERLPMWTHDINQLAEHVDADGETIVLPEQAAGLHNALADARHVKAMWEALTGTRPAVHEDADPGMPQAVQP